MKYTKIRIGTCVSGNAAEKFAPGLAKYGFETMSMNFHMSFDGVDLKQQGPRMKAFAEENGIEITTVGYYCNALQYEEHLNNLKYAIDCAHLYGASIVGTFAGALENQPIDASFKRFGEVYREVAKYAEDRGIKIAFENCPMGGTWDRATCNIAINPRAWEAMFNEVPGDTLGLEWEPAHQMIQLIDPIAQLRKWAKKVYHMHGKDASIDWNYVRENGVLCNTDRYAPERTPGFGDTNWRDVFSILHENGYSGDVCIEGYHDPVYSGDWEMTGQMHALKYLKFCRGGDFVANPW